MQKQQQTRQQNEDGLVSQQMQPNLPNQTKENVFQVQQNTKTPQPQNHHIIISPQSQHFTEQHTVSTSPQQHNSGQSNDQQKQQLHQIIHPSKITVSNIYKVTQP